MKTKILFVLVCLLTCTWAMGQTTIRRKTNPQQQTQPKTQTNTQSKKQSNTQPKKQSNTQQNRQTQSGSQQSRQNSTSQPASSAAAKPVVTKNNVENGIKFTVGGVSFTMVCVAGGTFSMGSSDSEADSDEQPVHSVTLSGYLIGETEVTQALWLAVMGSNPSNWKGDDLPVERVSWDDCREFIGKLNVLTGASFRLPTEAEWEYAARGGNKSVGRKYSGSDTIGEVAWYDGNSSNKTHAVKSKRPNELGLYDMSGNVWEWCQDWYGGYGSGSQTNPTGPSSGSYRVRRGGSWRSNAWYCRVSDRLDFSPVSRVSLLGLRLAL